VVPLLPSVSIRHPQPPSRPAFPASSAAVAADLGGLHSPSAAAVAVSPLPLPCRRGSRFLCRAVVVFLQSRGPRILALVSSAPHPPSVCYLLHRTVPYLSRRPPAVACCAALRPASAAAHLLPICLLRRTTSTACWLLRPAVPLQLLSAARRKGCKIGSAPSISAAPLQLSTYCTPQGLRNQICTIDFCVVRRLRRSGSASFLLLRRWLPLRAESSGQQPLSNSASAPKTSVNSYSGCC
jgi:hypothetical protein